jgi:NAD(P)-dependent dehydrogenase (short-subunit alcohol dehydrogenase family)
MRLANKIAIVTGASRGMGAEIALSLAREGADVVLAARTITEAEVGKPTRPGTTGDVAARIREMGRRALPVKTDVSVREDVENLMQTAVGEFGRVEILVNSAWFVNFSEMPLSDFLDADKTDATLGTFKGTIDVTRAVLPQMVERKSGSVINITSWAPRPKCRTRPSTPVSRQRSRTSPRRWRPQSRLTASGSIASRQESSKRRARTTACPRR